MQHVNILNIFFHANSSSSIKFFCGPDGAENWVRKSMTPTLWPKTIKPTGVPVTVLGAQKLRFLVLKFCQIM